MREGLSHVTVLLHEAVDALAIKQDGIMWMALLGAADTVR